MNLNVPLRLALAGGGKDAEASLPLGQLQPSLVSKSVREHLRRATAEIHERLHHARPFARIADGSIDAAGYGAVLGSLYRYHATMAMLCVRGAAALEAPELAEAHGARLAALRSDLACFGRTLSFAGPDICRDDAFCAGCLYTVQGSTLGGKVIYRQLDGLLSGEDGRGFFKGTPADSALWQKLCAGLEKFARPVHLASLEQGAMHAFARFESLLDA